jgi:uncharacterized membrane protein YebE (DUF533 family)
MKTKMMLSILTLAAAGGALAQTATPRVEQREQNQERRIEQGVNSGQLTQREANRLENQQQRVDRAQDKARADGHVTTRERARLHNMQERASRDIAREKHDRQRDLNRDGRKDRPQRPTR